MNNYSKTPNSNTSLNNGSENTNMALETNLSSQDVAAINSETRRTEGVRDLLAQFSTEAPGQGLDIARHVDPKYKVSLPEGMATAKAAKILAEAAKAEQEEQVFTKTFKYRPWDGAAALNRVLEKYFGTTGRGVAIQTFFGPIKPKQIEIEVAFGKTITVPWGHIQFVALEGTLMLGSAYDEEYGALFQLSIECPKRFSAEVSGLFNLLEHELAEHSIYKGSAIRGTDEPRFLPVTVDSSIVYNDDVYASLETSVWGVIREAELMRRLNVKTDPKVLLHGPYGTGKSEAGRMTAKVATENGWTFIAFNSGKSTVADLEKTLQTARLLAPAVVFVEDLDIYAAEQDEKAQTRMLEMFDGISSKGHEVLVLMTSNKPASFSKGMLRAGRINKMIEIGALDRQATEKLIKLVNGEQLGEVDFDQVWEATEGYEPAFIRQTFDDARQSAAIRHATELRAAGTFTETEAQKFKLVTEDFVTAANLMRPQHDQHEAASGAANKPTLGGVLEALVVDILTNKVSFDNDNIGEVSVQEIEAASR